MKIYLLLKGNKQKNIKNDDGDDDKKKKQKEWRKER